MRNIIIIALLICNAFFIAYMLLYGSKYALNLMTEQQAYKHLISIDGVGAIKAQRIAEDRQNIRNIKDIDTKDIKYSKYFTIRSWDMRTNVIYVMFGISLLIQIIGFIWLCSKGIKVNISKYIVLDKE